MESICKDCLICKPLEEYYKIYQHCPIKVCKECYKNKQRSVYRKKHVKKEKTKPLCSKTALRLKVDFENIADFGMLDPAELKEMIKNLRDEILGSDHCIKIVRDAVDMCKFSKSKS